MSSQQAFLPTIQPEIYAIPVPLIIIIAIGCYLFIIILALIIRQCMQARGFCGECRCCGREEDQICQCCTVLGQTLNCFECRGINAAMKQCCPNRRRIDCVDIILCQCCADEQTKPICGIGNISCNCGCTAPECENINCLCFELRMKTPPNELLKQQAAMES